MAIKQGREYRALQDFSLVPRDEGSPEYRVRGTAIVFNTPTVLWECDGVEYKEIIDRHAFDECDMSDVIFNYNQRRKGQSPASVNKTLGPQHRRARRKHRGRPRRHDRRARALRGNRRRVRR